MLRLQLGALCVLLVCSACTQPYWGSTVFPAEVWGAGHLCTSNNADTLYYAGTIALGGDFWYNTNTALRYAGGVWDTLPGVVPGVVFSVLMHHDTLFIGGGFETLNGQSCGRVAYHNGAAWQPYGNITGSYVARLRVIEDTLYAVGAFNMADGQPAQSVAKRAGNAWVPVGQASTVGPIIGDITKFNGRLVVSGAISEGPACCAFQLIDGQWQPLGQGVLGGLSGVHSLAVYGSDLYLGGQFTTNTGNAGNSIMRWDGSTYHGLGLGLQYALGNTSTPCAAQLLVHGGLLWVEHPCFFAGGVPSKGVATWDGTEWCGVPGDVSSYGGGIISMAFYKDTLFASTYEDTVDGVFVNGLANFIGPSYVGECSGPVTMPEDLAAQSASQLVRLGQDQWEIIGPYVGSRRLTLCDAAGRTVLATRLNFMSNRSEPFSTAILPHGLFVAYLIGADGARLNLVIDR